MTKLTTIITAMVLVTGMVAAQPADLPKPGQTPGDLFYGLERASESLELAVASAPVIGSKELAAKVRANHAAERLAEAKELAERNRTENVEKLMQEYSENMNRSVQVARESGQPEFAERLRNVSRDQVQVLERVRDRVPEQARKGIDRAIENSQRNQQELDLPPQAKGPKNRPETGKEGLNISVEDNPGKKNSNPGSTRKDDNRNDSGRVDLGKLPTERPGSNGGEDKGSAESPGDTGEVAGQDSENTGETDLNDSLP
jgi:hypothetical protein